MPRRRGVADRSGIAEGGALSSQPETTQLSGAGSTGAFFAVRSILEAEKSRSVTRTTLSPHERTLSSALPVFVRPDRLPRVSLSGTSFSRRVWRAAVCLAMAVATGGCALSMPRWNPGGWLADFDTAERNAAESHRECLILYLGGRPGRASPLQQAFASKSLEAKIDGKVRCILTKSYEPDRRYVAQYGVNRAPAVILVHQDGTYHARTGPMTVEEIEAFLASATTPGAKPTINPHIAKRPNYDWLDSIDTAHARSKETGKPMLVVYYRSLSRDWSSLRKLLRRHEVCSRLDDMCHCRIAVPGFAQKVAVTPFGALRLPALVIVRPDGKHDVLEQPTSYEAVALFADRTLSAGAQRTAAPERISTFGGADTTKP